MADAASQKKALGNQAFGAGKWDEAIKHYSDAIGIDGTNHIFYSNRCAAYSSKGDFASAISDASTCIQIKPNFIKGYFRLASAYKESGDFINCMKICESGLKVESSHADLMRIKREIEGSFNQQNASRMSGLSREEQAKEEGNALFKDAKFEDAVIQYGKAYNLCGDKSTVLACTILNNRAACQQQLSNYQAVIEDTSIVLEHQPDNFKALLRRGLAFEGMERYRFALEDIRKCLLMDSKHDIANRAQHRISAAVRQLKAQS